MSRPNQKVASPIKAWDLLPGEVRAAATALPGPYGRHKVMSDRTRAIVARLHSAAALTPLEAPLSWGDWIDRYPEDRWMGETSYGARGNTTEGLQLILKRPAPPDGAEISVYLPAIIPTLTQEAVNLLCRLLRIWSWVYIPYGARK